MNLPSITIPQLKEIETSPNVWVIDVRSMEEYNEGHIPVAKNIPVDTLINMIPNIPEGTQIVTACGRGGGRSRKALEILLEHGVNAQWLEGGSLGYLDTLKPNE